MTAESMNLQDLLEKTTDADFLREMIGFTAQRLMDMEVEALTGAPPGVRSPTGPTSATAIASTAGRPGPARSNGISQNCGKAATSQASSSLAA